MFSKTTLNFQLIYISQKKLTKRFWILNAPGHDNRETSDMFGSDAGGARVPWRQPPSPLLLPLFYVRFTLVFCFNVALLHKLCSGSRRRRIWSLWRAHRNNTVNQGFPKPTSNNHHHNKISQKFRSLTILWDFMSHLWTC